MLILVRCLVVTDHQAEQRAAAREAPCDAPTPWYMRQRVRNACGTVAIVHAIANAGNNGELYSLPPEAYRCTHHFHPHNMNLLPQSLLANLVNSSLDDDPAERGRRFATSEAIAAAHQQCMEQAACGLPSSDIAGKKGTTPFVPRMDLTHSAAGDVSEHFCTFVRVGSHIWELDGAMEEAPLYHGPTTAPTFLGDAARLIQANFMSQDPTSNQWSLLALAPAGEVPVDALVGQLAGGLRLDEGAGAQEVAVRRGRGAFEVPRIPGSLGPSLFN